MLSPLASVGLISDTHGLLREEAIDALRGCHHIIHAGDVGKPDILRRLEELAPVTVVRGNVDSPRDFPDLPLTAAVTVADKHIYVVHILDDIDIDAETSGVAAVIYGHSHKPDIRERNAVLYINPGSAGPRRFSLPITVARLEIHSEGIKAHHIHLPG